jgi:hypothetical protein
VCECEPREEKLEQKTRPNRHAKSLRTRSPRSEDESLIHTFRSNPKANPNQSLLSELCVLLFRIEFSFDIARRLALSIVGDDGDVGVFVLSCASSA